MNFLSHYYFERFAVESERVVGCLLPDLLKNIDKSYTFHPLRYEEELMLNAVAAPILEGWKRHVEVDKLFHSSDFFVDHCHQFRKRIVFIFENTDIRTTFYAHIAIELMLDHLLIVDKLINVSRLYEHLEAVDHHALRFFLQTIELEDIDSFFDFLERFIKSRYIHKYENVEALTQATLNICKRLWTFELNAGQQMDLVHEISSYTTQEMKGYKEIFNHIQDKLD